MKKNKYFFIDAECDGLNGAFISVAMIVTNEKFNEIERKYIGICKDKLIVNDKWTRENVVPYMGEYYGVSSECELLEEVWHFWRKYADEAYAVGDVIFPVEARLFQKCINRDITNRNLQGPFPLLDLSSLIFAKRMNPLIPREQIISSDRIITGKRHNALYDVEIMIENFKYLMGGTKVGR